VARRVRPETQTDVFLGLERPTATRLFFVEGPRTLVERVGVDLNCAGFSVRCEGVSGAATRARLVVRLAQRRYSDIFATLAADVIGALPARGDHTTTLDAMADRLARWERFLALRGPEGLTRLQQHGLFGELWFLLHHALPNCGVARSVDAWTGPLARPQDFQFASVAIEVKTTTAGGATGIQVASVRQLDPPAGVRLFLLHLELEERSGRGETLPDLVAHVRAALAGHEMRFNDRLLEVGYADADSVLYRTPAYVVRRHRFFEVRDLFPRITEAELRVGVVAVEYTIAVAACEGYVVPDLAVTTAIGSGA
jgi:hypothetical protein